MAKLVQHRNANNIYMSISSLCAKLYTALTTYDIMTLSTRAEGVLWGDVSWDKWLPRYSMHRVLGENGPLIQASSWGRL